MRDRLHWNCIYNRYAPAGRLHRHRLGRPCIRNSMDGGRINAGVYTLYRDNYKKQNKRVINITVKPTITDCTGSVWFTDLMLQEGDKVTGFVINT